LKLTHYTSMNLKQSYRNEIVQGLLYNKLTSVHSITFFFQLLRYNLSANFDKIRDIIAQ